MKYIKNNQDTKSDIKKAFLCLLKNHSYRSISISIICQKVGINRSTFYYHYETIEHLLKNIYADYFDEVRRSLEIDESLIFSEKQDNFTKLVEFLNECSKPESTFRFLLNKSPENLFLNSFTNWGIFPYANDKGSKNDFYQILYHYSGSSSIIVRWIKDGCPISSFDLAKIIYDSTTDAWPYSHT